MATKRKKPRPEIPASERTIWSVADIAEQGGPKRTRIFQAMKNGELRNHKVGGRRYAKRADASLGSKAARSARPSPWRPSRPLKAMILVPAQAGWDADKFWVKPPFGGPAAPVIETDAAVGQTMLRRAT